ncbi:NADPH-dependent oxidoreductase [Planosporangium flavigriseum]|uniref:FMN reductase n=1 Tax=Planosporangium flavigriseum TaxID=373681 RepID=A0A8J3LQ34_9ACTN|nr:NAD(P)H-dependent oxidoreductase [Planosporangium flavigriseum]NJC63138.1 NADPH-dependent oxidoreductase [Planosporangium flavigriseum]GIG76752.1 FMN reductase [Planosporangium flavigriseum]
MKVTVVVGNPKPQSRTADAGALLAKDLTDVEPEVIDVVDFAPRLLGWGDEQVADIIQRVQGSDLVVVASPTFKATYTGLLKLFLDQFATGTGLAGVVAVPMMLGAGPAHHLAPELLLKPVLVELGATCPTQGLYQLDSSYRKDPSWEAWLKQWRPVVTSLLDGASTPTG